MSTAYVAVASFGGRGVASKGTRVPGCSANTAHCHNKSSSLAWSTPEASSGKEQTYHRLCMALPDAAYMTRVSCVCQHPNALWLGTHRADAMQLVVRASKYRAWALTDPESFSIDASAGNSHVLWMATRSNRAGGLRVCSWMIASSTS